MKIRNTYIAKNIEDSTFLKGSVSRDFRPPFFHDSNLSEPLKNSVLILSRCSITKFEKFDSVVCMTPRNQNFRLSKSKKCSSDLFFHP